MSQMSQPTRDFRDMPAAAPLSATTIDLTAHDAHRRRRPCFGRTA
jgi:hypothetical protein